MAHEFYSPQVKTCLLPNGPAQRHMMSQTCVCLKEDLIATVSNVVAAVEKAVTLPAYRHAVAKDMIDPGTKGACLGFDFHLTEQGPKLIEINTNAGGALMGKRDGVLGNCVPPADVELSQLIMFEAEWKAWAMGRPLRYIAIVDSNPVSQPMYPEFQMYRTLFESAGYKTVICDPGKFSISGDRLKYGRYAIDLVYNRLCDFNLSDPAHTVLRSAYDNRLALITPHPFAHALYADKRRLSLLGDALSMAELGLDPASASLLQEAIPLVRPVTEDMWAERKNLFFKPIDGYGSRGVYDGAKLTKKVWLSILDGRYVAQQTVTPSFCKTGEGQALKMDLRAFSYGGKVQHLTARLFRGQTTNFRTPGGGFAPVHIAA